MKIVINASLLDDHPSGLGIYSLNLVPRLVKLNNSGEILVYSSRRDVFDISEIAIKKIPKILQPKYGKIAGILRFFWTQFIFPFMLKQEQVIYSPTHHGILWGNFKQIITIHDLLPLKFPKQYPLQNFYFRYILPKLIRKSVAVITISKNTMKDIQEYYNVLQEKIHVIYNGLDHKSFSNDNLSMVNHIDVGKYFLIVGASYPHKNISKVLDAFLLINQVFPEISLVIIGGREKYIDILKREVYTKKIKNVKFIGYVSFQELKNIYFNAIALVYPSLYEGFGLPPIEAMACGCPVITSNTSSLPEVCGDSALYVNPQDSGNIAEMMLKVARNEEIRASLQIKGLERAKFFNWDKTAQEINQVINSIR